MLPHIMGNYNITEDQADKLFLSLITGAFAVNRAMGWKKNDAWYNVQKILLTFMEGGYKALEKL